jgi:hypothetical protein
MSVACCKSRDLEPGARTCVRTQRLWRQLCMVHLPAVQCCRAGAENPAGQIDLETVLTGLRSSANAPGGAAINPSFLLSTGPHRRFPAQNAPGNRQQVRLPRPKLVKQWQQSGWMH